MKRNNRWEKRTTQEQAEERKRKETIAYLKPNYVIITTEKAAVDWVGNKKIVMCSKCGISVRRVLKQRNVDVLEEKRVEIIIYRSKCQGLKHADEGAMFKKKWNA